MDEDLDVLVLVFDQLGEAAGDDVVHRDPAGDEQLGRDLALLQHQADDLGVLAVVGGTDQVQLTQHQAEQVDLALYPQINTLTTVPPLRVPSTADCSAASAHTEAAQPSSPHAHQHRINLLKRLSAAGMFCDALWTPLG